MPSRASRDAPCILAALLPIFPQVAFKPHLSLCPPQPNSVVPFRAVNSWARTPSLPRRLPLRLCRGLCDPRKGDAGPASPTRGQGTGRRGEVSRRQGPVGWPLSCLRPLPSRLLSLNLFLCVHLTLCLHHVLCFLPHQIIHLLFCLGHSRETCFQLDGRGNKNSKKDPE